MQITVSIEELRGFELRLKSWYATREGIFDKYIADHSKMEYSSMGDHVDGARRAVFDWEKKNPEPKLIPSA